MAIAQFVNRLKNMLRRKAVSCRRNQLRRKSRLEFLERRELMTNTVWGGTAGFYEWNTNNDDHTVASVPASAGFWRGNDDGDYSDSVTVTYRVEGTANHTVDPQNLQGNEDHSLAGGTVTIPAGQWSYDLPYVVYNDTIEEPEETIRIIITNVYSSTGKIYENPGYPADGFIVSDDPYDGGPPVQPTEPRKPVTVVDPSNQGGHNGKSKDPIRYADGAVVVSWNDLSSDAGSIPWGVTRSWTNVESIARQNAFGLGTVIQEQPFLSQADGDTVAVIVGGHTSFYFDLTGSTYQPRGFLQESLVHNSTSGEYAFTDTSGATFVFHDFSPATASQQRGQLKGYHDPAGNSISLTYDATTKLLSEAFRVNGATVESFQYNYLSSGDSAGQVASITLRRQENGGAWTTIRKAEYAYHGANGPHGNQLDIKTVTIKDGNNNVLDTTYYRYYTQADIDSGKRGYLHGLKYVFDAESHARLVASFGSNLDAISDSVSAPYAQQAFEYDSHQRATKHVIRGFGSSTTAGGHGTFLYSYTPSSHSDGFNSWAVKTTETLPDGNQNIIYTNFMGEVMLHAFHETATGQEWITYYRFDDNGRLILKADPSAVSGYDESNPDLVNFVGNNATHLRDTAGLVTTSTYYATTTASEAVSGGAAGYLSDLAIRSGETGTSIPQAHHAYYSRTALGKTVYYPATEVIYAGTDGSGSLTTSYAYAYLAGSVQIHSETVTDPAGGVTTVFYDGYRRPIWTKDAGGYIAYVAYDDKTGAVVKTIEDVDTSRTGEFSGLPSGWTTVSGGGLHLVTTYEVDGLGRTIKLTDANGNITYTVYNDANHEARVYSGWNTTTNTPTGPTIVVRDDRTNSYSETLTMSAVPTISAGRPTGTEAIGNLQSLSRTFYTSGDQATEKRDYFNLSGLAYSVAPNLGTLGTHYHRTQVGFDDAGRAGRTVRGDGTIYRTAFDGLGRPVSDWIGTNDSPASGTWSPTNPADMVMVKTYTYDNGGVGDGLLTDIADALNRVTNYDYDFRSRVTSTTLADPDGAGPLTAPVYATGYDNLDRIVQQVDPLGNSTSYVHDVINRTVTTTHADPDGNGPLARPVTVQAFDARGLLASETNALSHITVYQYDGAGRLIKGIHPDPDGAGVQTAPISQYAYDKTGNLTSVIDPMSQITSYGYDKAYRRTSVTQADPDGAGSLSAPVTSYAFDAAGMLQSTTDPVGRTTSFEYDRLGRMTKQTKPDPDGSSVGVLAGMTRYAYDAANRLTSVAEVAPNENIAPAPSAPTKVIIDNGDPGYFSTGFGTNTGAGIGYQNDEQWAGPSGGLKYAEWTASVPAGRYLVAITYAPWSTRATNSPFTVYNGSNSLGTVIVNQELAPADFTADSANWKTLGTYDITNGSIKVRLTNQANDYVMADGVRFFRIGDINPSVTIDDFNTGSTRTGSWTNTSTPYAWAGDFSTANAGAGNTTTWTTTVTPGIYSISASGNGGIVYSSTAPYTIKDGGTTVSTVIVNQQVVPSDWSSGGINFRVLGEFAFTSNTASVILSGANGQVWADAVHFYRIGDLPTQPSADVQAIDDGDAAFTTTSGWSTGTGEGAYSGDNHSALAGSGSLTATWMATVTPGKYRIATTWERGTNRATNAPYTVFDGATSLGTVAVNQELYPEDFRARGVNWKTLGVFTITATTLAVQLSNSADPNEYVIADAVYLQRVGDLDPEQTTAYEYDEFDNLVETTQPDPDGVGPLTAPVTLYDFDNASQLLSLTDPVGNLTQWQYDAIGRVTNETNELNKSRTFKYDAAGNLAERTDRLGRKIEYVYDNLYRNTAEKWWDGASLGRTLSFTYDAASQLTAASDPAASYAYAYDGLGRVTNNTQTIVGLTPQVAYQSKYNAAGSRTELAASLGGTADFKNTYGYDNLQRLTSIKQQSAGGNSVAEKRADIGYTPASQFDKIARYADVAGSQSVANTFYAYDGAARLKQLTHTSNTAAPISGFGTGAMAGYQYAYDQMNRITSINSLLDGLTAYTHDNTDQLTGADHTGQVDESYSYDANGNRTGGGQSTGDNNRLLSDGTYNFTYDDEGNRLTKTKIVTGEKEEYTWDHRNRLITVTFKNSAGAVTKTVDHTYDAFNQWIKRSVDADGPGPAAATSTYFSHEGGQVALQFDGAQASDLTNRYLWGAAVDQLLADEQVITLATPGNVLHPLGDHLGTLRDIADRNESTGVTTVTNHRRYDDYGNLISESNAAVDEVFGYTDEHSMILQVCKTI